MKTRRFKTIPKQTTFNITAVTSSRSIVYTCTTYNFILIYSTEFHIKISNQKKRILLI